MSDMLRNYVPINCNALHALREVISDSISTLAKAAKIGRSTSNGSLSRVIMLEFLGRATACKVVLHDDEALGLNGSGGV